VDRHGITIPAGPIAEFCRRNSIRRLALFGSFIRDDFGPESDIDVLVEYEPDAGVGLWGMAEMELQLSRMVGRKVDLRTANDLSRYFRDEVLASAEVVYAAS
jgi:uncharacterized protein